MKEEKRQQREEMMISLIEQWRESGKTQKVFCQEKGIALATFYYWLKRHRQRLDEKGFNWPFFIWSSFNRMNVASRSVFE